MQGSDQIAAIWCNGQWLHRDPAPLLGTPTDDRQPISPQVLSGLLSELDSICKSSYEASLFYAAALVAFFGALRISELVAQSRAQQRSGALLFQDVHFTDVGVNLGLRRSKTDQLGRGAQISLGYCELEDLCPVRALRKFISLRGSSPGLLFCHLGGAPLTKHQFWAVTTRALAKLGLCGVRFCTHSFRIGAASTAAAMGLPSSVIQHVGRWHSNAFRSFIRPLSKF